MASLSPTNVFECYAEFTTGRFDVWAERGIHVVWSDRAVENFDQWLVNYANATLKTIADFYERRPPPFPPDAVLLDLRNRLGDRIQYWKGEARRYRIEQEAHKATLKNANPVSEVNGALIRRRRRLVREYRQREDLTADGFARRVGMSDTAIRGIINEDRKRFAPDKQGKLVSVLGITLREWYQER